MDQLFDGFVVSADTRNGVPGRVARGLATWVAEHPGYTVNYFCVSEASRRGSDFGTMWDVDVVLSATHEDSESAQ